MNTEIEVDIFASVIETENNASQNTIVVEDNILDKTIDQIIDERENKAVKIPQMYIIFSTDNNQEGGKRNIVDTYYTDKIKQIIPIGKAIAKAKLMKNALKKTHFVLEVSHSAIEGTKRIVTKHEKIVFTA